MSLVNPLKRALIGKVKKLCKLDFTGGTILLFFIECKQISESYRTGLSFNQENVSVLLSMPDLANSYNGRT